MGAATCILPQAANGNLTSAFLKTDGNRLGQLDLFGTAVRQIIQEGWEGVFGVTKDDTRLATPMMCLYGLPTNALNQMADHMASGVQPGMFQSMVAVDMQFYGAQRQAYMQVMQYMAVAVLCHMQNLVPIYRAFVTRLATALRVK